MRADLRVRLFADVFRVLLALPSIEYRRTHEGPKSLLESLRARAHQRMRRHASELARLRRIIRFVDARVPGGGNCYRRALLEIALDAGAATGALSLGLRAKGGPLSGHAWLGGGSADDGQRYDAQFVV